MVGLKKIIKP